MSDLPPAGWHDDPDDPGQHRYWDGHNWTEHRAPKHQTPEQTPATTRQPFRLSNITRNGWIAVGVVLVLIVIGVVNNLDSTPTRSPQSDRGDASARVACDHFRNVAADISDGVLTDAEIRAKLQEIDESAGVSEVPGIASNSRAMLAAFTQGTDPTSAIEGFSDACRSIGH